MSFGLSFIGSVLTDYVIEPTKSAYRKTRDFVCHRVLPHEGTISALFMTTAGAFILSQYALEDAQYIQNMGHLDDALIEIIPALVLEIGGVKKLYSIALNRWKEFQDDRCFEALVEEGNARPKEKAALCLFTKQVADHNGALRLDREQMQKNIQVLAEDHFMVRRLVRSDVDVERTIREVQAKLGENRPIKVTVLLGHGSNKKVWFSKTSLFSLYRFMTGAKPVFTAKASEGFKLLPAGGEAFLISCSTGKEGGLASELSKIHKIGVYGPEKVISADSIRFVVECGRLEMRSLDYSSRIRYHHQDLLESITVELQSLKHVSSEEWKAQFKDIQTRAISSLQMTPRLIEIIQEAREEYEDRTSTTHAYSA